MSMSMIRNIRKSNASNASNVLNKNLGNTSLKLLKLAKSMYKGRDVSHGLNHVNRVRVNALEIANKLNIEDKNVIVKIETAALFHDLWDHKYVSNTSSKFKEIKDNFKRELRNMYMSEHDIKDIEIIINNISLSREMRYKEVYKVDLDLKHLQLIRDIVSDADKLEMLGTTGINRIIQYQMHKYPETKSVELKGIVKKVYDEKISKLLREEYIKTEPGREMAEPLMKEMEEYIKGF